MACDICCATASSCNAVMCTLFNLTSSSAMPLMNIERQQQCNAIPCTEQGRVASPAMLSMEAGHAPPRGHHYAGENYSRLIDAISCWLLAGVQLWFARVLRDAFAAQAAGLFRPFKEIGAYHLDMLLRAAGKDSK